MALDRITAAFSNDKLYKSSPNRQHKNRAINYILHYCFKFITLGFGRSLLEDKNPYRNEVIVGFAKAILPHLGGYEQFKERANKVGKDPKGELLYTNAREEYQVYREGTKFYAYAMIAPSKFDLTIKPLIDSKVLLIDLATEDRFSCFKQQLEHAQSSIFNQNSSANPATQPNFVINLDESEIELKEKSVPKNELSNTSAPLVVATLLQVFDDLGIIEEQFAECLVDEKLAQGNGLTDLGKKMVSYFKDSKCENERKAKLKIVSKEGAPLTNEAGEGFEATFKLITGISFLEFMQLIYSTPGVEGLTFAEQTYAGKKKAYENFTPTMDNSQVKLSQEFNYNGLKITTAVQGTKTFSSNGQKINPHLFEAGELKKDDELKDYKGINVNTRCLTVAGKNHKDEEVNLSYPMVSIGSYQINSAGAIKNAKELFKEVILPKTAPLQDDPVAVEEEKEEIVYEKEEIVEITKSSNNRIEDQPNDYKGADGNDAVADDYDYDDDDDVDYNTFEKAEDSDVQEDSDIEQNLNSELEESSIIVLDFKPLKRLPLINHDSKIFKTHTLVTSKAVVEYNKDQPANQKLCYVPVWGNSHALPLQAAPESNGVFQQVVAKMGKCINELKNKKQKAELRLMLNELTRLTDNKSSYTQRGKFRKIFALSRLIAAHFPKQFRIIGGCMSAKDRMQALIYSSEIIIQLYHIKGNLDFIDENGCLTPALIGETDIAFLKMHLNNVIGYNFLSQMGIGRLNNKNLDLLAAMFKNIPVLSEWFSQKKLISTSA